MDWRSIKFDWNRARAFLVTAEEGSYTAAAEALGLTQTTLGRQVASLEKELGLALFEKVGRGLQITPAGAELIRHVRMMGEAASSLSLSASGQASMLEGSVCISATESSSALLLPKLLTKFRQQEPGIDIEIVASDATSDLRRREADIAIRNAEPTDPELIARRLPDSLAHLYASPTYLKQLQQPLDLAALNQSDYIGFTDNANYLGALRGLGLDLSSRNFPYITSSHLVHWELVKQGAGIGVMSELIAKQESLVERVYLAGKPEQLTFPAIKTWLVVHRDLRTNIRIRRVFDFLVAELTEQLSS